MPEFMTSLLLKHMSWGGEAVLHLVNILTLV